MSQLVTSLLSSTNHNHSPTTLPMATMTWHPMPTTTHECPITTTSQKTKMTVHKWRQLPTNDNEHPPKPMTTQLMNDAQVPWMDTGSDYPRWVNSPLTSWLVNTKSRCHVAVCNVATKQRMITNVIVHHCCLFLTPRWVPPMPCLSQPTLLRHKTTTNRHRRHRAKVSQGCGANMWQWHDDNMAQWQPDSKV